MWHHVTGWWVPNFLRQCSDHVRVTLKVVSSIMLHTLHWHIVAYGLYAWLCHLVSLTWNTSRVHPWFQASAAMLIRSVLFWGIKDYYSMACKSPEQRSSQVKCFHTEFYLQTLLSIFAASDILLCHRVNVTECLTKESNLTVDFVVELCVYEDVCVSGSSLLLHRHHSLFSQQSTKKCQHIMEQAQIWVLIKGACRVMFGQIAAHLAIGHCHVWDDTNFGILEIMLSLSSPLAIGCTMEEYVDQNGGFCGKVIQQIQLLRMISGFVHVCLFSIGII